MKLQAHIIFTFLLAAVLFSCTTPPSKEDVSGDYRAVLKSPCGALAFPVTISHFDDSLTAFTTNGADTAYFNDVFIKRDSLIMGFDFYDSYLRGEVNIDGSLSGKWTRRAPGGTYSTLPFTAEKGESYRYSETSVQTYPFEGNWDATFTDEDGNFPAQGTFVSEPGGILHGTFQTETGDYRFLEGSYTDSSFTLSTFDGAHAFLFKARLHPDGSLEGDFWSRDTYHATWTAKKGEGNLRDPLQISAEEAVGKQIEFAFTGLDGEVVKASDPLFKNKPMLVYLFGSWCPNCADEVNMLRELYAEQYKDTDLEVVGLAYEFTGDLEKDTEMVGKYRKRFNIPWTLLVAGISDKQKAAETLPFLDAVISYPTSIFIDRNHKIEAIHVGFNGPATGSTYYREIQRFKDHINQIINS